MKMVHIYNETTRLYYAGRGRWDADPAKGESFEQDCARCVRLLLADDGMDLDALWCIDSASLTAALEVPGVEPVAGL